MWHAWSLREGTWGPGEKALGKPRTYGGLQAKKSSQESVKSGLQQLETSMTAASRSSYHGTKTGIPQSRSWAILFKTPND